MRLMKVKEFIERRTKEISESVGKKKVLAAVSGGIDSLTASLLVNRALPGQLKCLFIDTGFMRENEPEETVESLGEHGLDVYLVDFSRDFLESLKGISDAEEKRKIFRGKFYEVLMEEAKELGVEFLVQGTIAPDWIETTGGIKTQHNILEQIGIDPMEHYGFRVIEPILELYKNQVRAVARYLGVGDLQTGRQPFPGPGLLVRVVGEVTQEKLEVERRAEKIVEEGLAPFDFSQFFSAIFEKSASQVALEGVERLLGMDSRYWTSTSRVTGIKGGVRHYASPLFLDEPSLEELGIDRSVELALKISDLEDATRLLVNIGGEEREGRMMVAIRAVKTEDFMEASVAEAPIEVSVDLAHQLLNLGGVSSVYYDVTPKPPATIEFE